MQIASRVAVYAAGGERYVYSTHAEDAQHLLDSGRAISVSKRGKPIRKLHLSHQSPKPDGPVSSQFFGPSYSVSHKVQGKGNKRWIARLDRADSGLIGSSKRLVMPLGIPHHRLGTGKAERPASQFA